MRLHSKSALLLLLPQLPGMRSEAGEKSIQLKLRPVREVQGQRQSQTFHSIIADGGNGNGPIGYQMLELTDCSQSNLRTLPQTVGREIYQHQAKGSSGINNSNSSRSWQVEGHGNDSVFRIL
ncbi:hypothetical protein ACLKA6_005582 [Drosophila palustris]